MHRSALQQRQLRLWQQLYLLDRLDGCIGVLVELPL
jgi:hypothetical protein